ncbi:hypothetical protein A2U01_0066423, partial [Trifolium medium]|nr:hypothetical protein [Trifolium medium]
LSFFAVATLRYSAVVPPCITSLNSLVLSHTRSSAAVQTEAAINRESDHQQ